ncbi:MAG: hypothetical protein II931_05905 [Clostridia bacterium]|nr:hypothetical protein [Clostridia bacterium]
MDCSIIYYIAYKTGYIQRNLNKKFNTIPDIKVTSTVAAVSEEDLSEKFGQSLEKTNLIMVIGGLSAAEKRNVMTILSDYFNNHDLEVTFNKKVVNPDGGKDGYLIRSGEKYIAVLPDEPEEINKMFGSELMKNINISPDTAANMPEPVITHSVVSAPEPDYSLDKLKSKKRPDILLTVFITLGIIIALATAVWVYSLYM